MKNVIIIFTLFTTISLLLFSCNKNNNAPDVILNIFPSTGSTMTPITIDLSESTDLEDNIDELEIRVDWENDGIWDSEWTSEKQHTQKYENQGEHTIKIEMRDTDDNVTSAFESFSITNSSNLVPANSPFSYNLGINYETWTQGRNQRVIGKDLDTITKYFRLIKTFHTEGVGTTEVVIDPTMKEVIDYVLSHDNLNIELVMGTGNNMLADGGYGTPFTAGHMTTKTYTDSWVQMLINSFQNADNVIKHVKLILLGNEIDMNGPPLSDAHYKDYYSSWIPDSFNNLKASLQEAGLGNIPISTTIANYPLSNPNAEGTMVQYTSVKHIKDNWSSVWNSNKSLVLFNQYTLNSGKDVDFGPVINYFENVDKTLNGTPSVYVGETGFSAEYQESNEAIVINQVFSWLEAQYTNQKLTVPLFIFDAFDRPDKPAGQKKMGIFSDNSATNNPGTVKPGINIPSWTIKPKGK